MRTYLSGFVAVIACLLLLPLYAVASATTGGYGQSESEPYLDPDIADIINTGGEANVIVAFKAAPQPELPGKPTAAFRTERAKVLAEARRAEFDGKIKALEGYMSASGEAFSINEIFPLSLSLVAIVRDRATLERLSRFSLLKSLHWADRPIELPKPSMLPVDDDPPPPDGGGGTQKPAPPSGETDGKMHRQLINQPAAATAGYTGTTMTVAVIEPRGNSHNEHVLTYNSSISNPSFRVKKRYRCTTIPCAVEILGHDYWTGITAASDRTLDNHHEAVWRSIALAAPDASIVHFYLDYGTEPTHNHYKRILDTINELTASGVETIDVVNFSSGAGAYSQPCRSASVYDTEVADLAALGIAIVAAAGNEAIYNKLNDPACHPEVISVGNLYAQTSDLTEYPVGSWSCAAGKIWHPGEISCWSNSAWYLDFMAPGCGYLMGADSTDCGTSFAAPMVAGSIAVIKQASPHMTVDTIVDLLKAQGGEAVEKRSWNGVSANRTIDVIDLGVTANAAHAIAPPESGSGSTGSGDPNAPATHETSKTIITVISELFGL